MIRYIPNAKPFRLAAMNCHYIKFPLSYFLDRAEAYGFRCIELFGAMPHFFMDADLWRLSACVRPRELIL